jgi:hypothetical protein
MVFLWISLYDPTAQAGFTIIEYGSLAWGDIKQGLFEFDVRAPTLEGGYQPPCLFCLVTNLDLGKH